MESGNQDPEYAPAKNLTLKDYKPIKWSTVLEWCAQIRAAESTVYYDHIRPCAPDNPKNYDYRYCPMFLKLEWIKKIAKEEIPSTSHVWDPEYVWEEYEDEYEVPEFEKETHKWIPELGMWCRLDYTGTLVDYSFFTGGECLAKTDSGIMGGIETWYNEKDSYINHIKHLNMDTEKEIKKYGFWQHYEALIDPSYEYAGVGAFAQSSDKDYGVAIELDSGDFGIGDKQNKLEGKYTQKMAVQSSHISKPKISGAAKIKVKKSKKYSVVRTISFNYKTNIKYSGKVKWRSSKKSVATINSSGRLTAKKKGVTEISATLSNGKVLKKKVTVK